MSTMIPIELAGAAVATMFGGAWFAVQWFVVRMHVSFEKAVDAFVLESSESRRGNERAIEVFIQESQEFRRVSEHMVDRLANLAGNK